MPRSARNGITETNSSHAAEESRPAQTHSRETRMGLETVQARRPLHGTESRESISDKSCARLAVEQRASSRRIRTPAVAARRIGAQHLCRFNLRSEWSAALTPLQRTQTTARSNFPTPSPSAILRALKHA